MKMINFFSDGKHMNSNSDLKSIFILYVSPNKLRDGMLCKVCKYSMHNTLKDRSVHCCT